MDISIILKFFNEFFSKIKDFKKYYDLIKDFIKNFKEHCDFKNYVRKLLKDIEKQKVIYESYINYLRNIYNIKSRDSYCLVILPNDFKKMAANLDEIPFLICKKKFKIKFNFTIL